MPVKRLLDFNHRPDLKVSQQTHSRFCPLPAPLQAEDSAGHSLRWLPLGGNECSEFCVSGDTAQNIVMEVSYNPQPGR